MWTPKILLAVLLIGFVALRLYFRRTYRPEQRRHTAKGREWILVRVAGVTQVVIPVLWLSTPVLDFADLDAPAWLRLGGFGLGLLSLAGLAWVHRSLGVNFSPRLDLRDEHQLVQHGPYRWVRHPMYTVGFGLLTAFSLISTNWVVAVAGLGGLGGLVAARIRDEEAMLAERFGDAWTAHARRTGRFLPWL